MVMIIYNTELSNWMSNNVQFDPFEYLTQKQANVVNHHCYNPEPKNIAKNVHSCWYSLLEQFIGGF